MLPENQNQPWSAPVAVRPTPRRSATIAYSAEESAEARKQLLAARPALSLRTPAAPARGARAIFGSSPGCPRSAAGFGTDGTGSARAAVASPSAAVTAGVAGSSEHTAEALHDRRVLPRGIGRFSQAAPSRGPGAQRQEHDRRARAVGQGEHRGRHTTASTRGAAVGSPCAAGAGARGRRQPP